MAFVPEFACGFEMGMMPVEAGRFEDSGSTATVSTSSPHTGLYKLVVATNPISVIRASAGDALDLSLWTSPNESYQMDITLEMADGGKVQLRRNHTTECWDLYVNNVLAASGSVATPGDAWQHIQIRATIAASGSYATKIDGQPDIGFSGDTLPVADDQITKVSLSGRSSSWDDMVFGTGGWPNDLRIDPLYVTADTTDADWTPSTGTDHYACVDDVPPSADYVYTDVDGRDIYTLADWDDTDGGGNVIKEPVAVVTWVQVRKEDGSRDDKVRFLQASGASEVQSDYTSLLTSYQNLHHLRVEQPGGGAWDKAGVDALLVGIEADMV
jgi:hypothetical protein